MTVIVLPVANLTHEDLDLDHIRRRYLEGSIDVEEMERDIERALRGEYDRPMGGL